MLQAVRYSTLPTEQINPRSRALDRLSIPQILRVMNREDAQVPRAVSCTIPNISRAVSLIVSSFREGGRLFFLGAGTSGRLGVIEAAECPPTFHTPPGLVQAIIAGGRGAVFRSKEGAEDDRAAAKRVVARRVRAGDVVVGIAASGVTPFVGEGLRQAKRLGASAILVTCHPGATARAFADVCIAPVVGPEALTGSTRLKAGTTTKLVLNMLTVASMVRLGKVYGNLMVDVRPTSRKLRARALRIISAVARVPERQAASALARSGGQVKTAIVMAALRIDVVTARTLLKQHDGHLSRVLAAADPPAGAALADAGALGSRPKVSANSPRASIAGFAPHCEQRGMPAPRALTRISRKIEHERKSPSATAGRQRRPSRRQRSSLLPR